MRAFLACVVCACASKEPVEPVTDAPATETVLPTTESCAPTSDAGHAADTGRTFVDVDAAGAAACAPITGTTPFGVRLSGSGPITDAATDVDGSVTATIDLYFPKGRVAGAEVVVAAPQYGGGSAVAYGVLDEALSARGLRVSDPGCAAGIAGDLVGPNGGIAAIATNNLSAPSDALELVHGQVTLCRSGNVPAQLATGPRSVIEPFAIGGRGFLYPNGMLRVGGARPFAASSFATVTAKTAACAVPLLVTTADPGVLISPVSETFSLFFATTIDLSGLRDVLGEPLGLSTVKTVVPTRVVSDFSFDAPLPSGSYVGTSPTVAGGRLRIAADGPWATAIAIGSSNGKSKLRIRHRLACDGTSSGPVVQIVSSDWKTMTTTPKCSATPVDETLSLTGGGPYVIFAKSDAGVPLGSCIYPPFGAPGPAYELDELTFE